MPGLEAVGWNFLSRPSCYPVGAGRRFIDLAGERKRVNERKETESALQADQQLTTASE